MKLESLNNSKYSLTPKKMGELVGGQKVVEITDGTPIKIAGSGKVISGFSQDVWTYASQSDYNHHTITSDKYFYGENDKSNAQQYAAQQR